MHQNDFFLKNKIIWILFKTLLHKIVGLFKRWWKMLPKLVLKIVVTCFVLHNNYITHDKKKT
jgi:hypothetical protein